MDLSKLTNYQLYGLIQNAKLDKAIRNLANSEFEKRNLGFDKIQAIAQKHDTQFVAEKDEPLKTEYKILVLLLPGLFPIYNILAAKWLGEGQKRKWKEYWLYLSLAYFIWTIVILVFSKYFLLSKQ